MANITSVFDKVRLCKGAWATSSVKHSVLGDQHGRSHSAYYSSGVEVDYNEKECQGVCAEGAIEWALGMESHGPKFEEPEPNIESVAWFRTMLRHVTLFYAGQYLKTWAREKRQEYDELRRQTKDAQEWASLCLDINYWGRIVNGGGVPSFNDDSRTTEEIVREYLRALEGQFSYRELEKHCRATDAQLAVLHEGYIAMLKNQNIDSRLIPKYFPRWHFDQLRTANVI